MHWATSAIKRVKSERIPHRNYERAVADVLAAIHACEPGEVVCLTGPSRVGKSKCIADVQRLLVGDRSKWPEGQMPFLTVLAGNDAASGAFSTRAFMAEALTAIEHPIFGQTTDDRIWSGKPVRQIEGVAEAVLKLAFTNAIKHRGTRYLAIDEAGHVGYVRGGDAAATAILDSWKCLAARTGVVLVLVGAYPLLRVLNLSPHLLGRAQLIHFPRYNAGVLDDVKAYDRFLKSHSQSIQLKDAASLSEWGEELINGSLGCAGLQCRWTRSALALAQSECGEALTLEHYRIAMRADSDLQVIAREILEGEEMMHAGNVGDLKSQAEVRESGRLGARKYRPFEAKPVRHVRGGRA